jgi:hypothetical protein
MDNVQNCDSYVQMKCAGVSWMPSDLDTDMQMVIRSLVLDFSFTSVNKIDCDWEMLSFQCQ